MLPYSIKLISLGHKNDFRKNLIPLLGKSFRLSLNKKDLSWELLTGVLGKKKTLLKSSIHKRVQIYVKRFFYIRGFWDLLYEKSEKYLSFTAISSSQLRFLKGKFENFPKSGILFFPKIIFVAQGNEFHAIW